LCQELFDTFYNGKSMIRHVSVSLTNLAEDTNTQLDLFFERPQEKDIGYTMDQIRAQFGSTAILLASSFTDAGTTLERSKKIVVHLAYFLSKPVVPSLFLPLLRILKKRVLFRYSSF